MTWFILWPVTIFANNYPWLYGGENSTPEKVLDYVADNADTKYIIESPFDDVYNKETFGNENKISWTLDSVRENVSFYLNWIVFLGLSAATVLIVYNWILLMTTPISGDQKTKVIENIKHIAIWIVAMTGFYFLIRIVLSILNLILET
jgi:hypothetical protein